MGNFDKDLASMFNEVQNWKSIKMDVPSGADQLGQESEKYRAMQENIMHVVREYNSMLDLLDQLLRARAVRTAVDVKVCAASRWWLRGSPWTV